MMEKKPAEQPKRATQDQLVDRLAPMPRLSHLEIDRQLGRHLVEAQRKERQRRTIK